jgi:glycosyltransferase involved in cell wall biosynthesis
MSSSPRVSVIIPCFNLGQYLPEAIASVRAQSFSDFEIIVVDDGSTEEETKTRLGATHGPNTRVIRSANHGLSAARNLGIRHAAGEYICSLDADDLLEPTWLARGVTLLDRHQEFGFVSHWLTAFGDEQWSWQPGRCDLGMLLDMNAVNGAALFRRSIVDIAGGFDESMREGCEDWEFWIRVTEAGIRGTIVPEVHYRYRRRVGSMSRVMNSMETSLRLYGDLIDKHPASYQAYLLDLLLRREWTIATLCRRIDSLQEELNTGLAPALAERLRELDRARARLSEVHAATAQRERIRTLDAQRANLERLRLDLLADRDRAYQRIDDLHRSWSWRLTLPLRKVYRWLVRPTSLGPSGQSE